MLHAQDIVSDQKVVTFTYVILDTEGEVIEHSDLPMSYIHGVDGKMYPSAEKAVDGARIGDEIECTITPEEGFGYPNPELMYIDRLENVPPEYRHIGAEAMFENSEGETITMTVRKIEDGEITLDANHPFAGRTVVFRFKIIGVRDATEMEIGTGEVIDLNAPLTMQ
jgi:FKBP-type peptidyl-prolyl cis-trans isomerase SlyD